MDKDNVLRMTHNEYQEFLRKNAERLHTEKGYSMADYERDADRVKVIGFELDGFKFSDNAKALINKVFDSEERDKRGNVLLRGHIIGSHEHAIGQALGCECVKNNYYNGFYKNDESRCIFEYCEGDLNLVLCGTEAAYYEALGRYYEFFGIKPKLDDVVQKCEKVSKGNAVSEKQTIDRENER